MIDVRFTNDHNRYQLGDVIKVLQGPRLWIPTHKDYPRHSIWLQKSEAEIESGQKRAMLGYAEKVPIGSIIYRQHEARANVLEIRNISINPEVHGRLFGAFMLRQVEIDATHNDFQDIDSITVDTKVSNVAMIGFLESQGYTVTNITDLYHDGTGEDVVLTKTLL